MKKKIHRLWRRTGRSAFLVILSCLFVVVPLPASALDVYVSTFDDGTIRKIDSATGSVTVVASELPSPEGIAIDSNGIMYIGGVYSVGVRRIRIADGVRLPDVGTNICGPEGPSIDSQGNVYFNTRSGPCDHSGVWQIAGGTATTATQVIPPFSQWGEGTAFLTRGPFAGCLIAADSQDSAGTRVVKSCSPTFGTATTFIGSIFPLGIASNSTGDIFVSTGPNILRFDSAGESKGIFAEGFMNAAFMQFDAADNLYVAEEVGGRVLKISPTGEVSVLASELAGPLGIALAPTAAAPVLTVPAPITVNEGMSFTFEVSATDADGPFPLMFSAANLPAGATFTPKPDSMSTWVFAWTPNSAQGGPAPYFVDFTVSDGQFSDTKTVEITVHDTIVDTDGDGVPDPPGYDLDGNGVVSPPGVRNSQGQFEQDNCPNNYNPDQADVCHNSPQTVTAQTIVTPPGSPTGSLNLTTTVTFNGGTTGTNVLPPDLFNTICRVIDNATGQEVPQAGVPEGPSIDLSVKTGTNPNGSLISVAANTNKTFSTTFDLRRFYYPNLTEGSFTIRCDYVNFAHIPLREDDDPTIWTGIIPTAPQSVFVGLYTFNGFYSPLSRQSFSQGTAVPVKFSLRNSSGAFVTTATAKLFVQQLPGGNTMPATPSGGSSAGNVFRYDFTNQQYVYSMSTKNMAVGQWQLKAQLDDGTTHNVTIILKSK